MSFKFRRDGAMFPTRVKNGELIIYVGSTLLSIPFKFLSEEFEYDNTEFSMCNVMCLLRNNECSIVMRFDGTVTKFDKNMEVIGFSKFDTEEIYKNTSYFPIGIVGSMKYGNITEHSKCNIYTINGSNLYVLECIGDPEPIEFSPAENPLYVKEILNGNRFFPRLVKESTNVYSDDEGKYTIKGKAIKTTGYVEI